MNINVKELPVYDYLCNNSLLKTYAAELALEQIIDQSQNYIVDLYSPDMDGFIEFDKTPQGVDFWFTHLNTDNPETIELDELSIGDVVELVKEVNGLQIINESGKTYLTYNDVCVNVTNKNKDEVNEIYTFLYKHSDIFGE